MGRRKIIFLDVDGTLVDYKGRLPESAAAAVRLARQQGHKVYICTGRSRAEVYPEIWDIGLDGIAFFRNLATLTMDYKYRKLLVAPETLKAGIMAEIDKEIAKGAEGSITCKMNSLSDKEMIDKLVEASQKGVKVRLMIRGICCLLPGVPGYTENITVKSIVGRFLEHSRIYSFGSGDMFISSADLMTRNVDRRVEIATPVQDPKIKSRILRMLDIMLQDNVKGRVLGANGKYTEVQDGTESINSQERFLEMFRG